MIEFQHLYDSRVKPLLIRLDNRKKVIIFIDVILVMIILNSIIQLYAPSFPMYVGSAYGLIFFIFMRMSFYQKYRKKYRATVVKEIVSIVDPHWVYYAGEGISYQSFLQSGLYRFSPASVQSNDYIAGKIEDLRFEFCTVKAIGQHFLFISTAKHKLAFSGIFLHTNLFSSLKHSTYLLPKAKKSMMGSVQQIKAHGELIITNNSTFDKAFDVYSTDKAEANQLLVGPLFKTFIELQATYGELSVSFLSTGIHVGIAMDTSFLNPQIYRSEMTHENAKLAYQTISDIPKLLERLNQLDKLLFES